MEGAYGTAALAVSRLISSSEEESQYPESFGLLRSVLRRRPVVLGFVVSILAEKLQGSHDAHAVGSSFCPTVIHRGVCFALEAILSWYDPSTPHRMEGVLYALGEDGCKALLDMTNTGALQLPWAHRFCLLHACLVDRNSDRGRWAWLPSASYSLCSSALQDLTRANDAKENNANLAINRVRHGTAQQGAAQREGGLRQGRERGTRPGLTAPRAVTVSRSALLRGGVGVGVDVGVEGVPPSVIARVCSAMARIGDASSAEGGTDVLSSKPGLLSNCDIPPRAGDLFEKGGDWLNSFRFKVRTLQEAIMGSAEGVGAGDQQCPLGEPRAPDEPSKEVGEVRFETVVRALRKSGYADSLILSIKEVLQATAPRSVHSCIGRKRKLPDGEPELVGLERVLESFLFGTGLRNVDVPGAGTSTSMGMGIGMEDGVDGTFAGPDQPSAPRRGRPASTATTACVFLQSLVTEGVPVRDVLLALMALRDSHDGHDSRGRACQVFPVGKEGFSSVQTSAELAPPRLSPDARRSSVAELVESLVAWFADDIWAWSAARGEDALALEQDIAVAARTISMQSGGGSCRVPSEDSEPLGSFEVLLENSWGCVVEGHLGGKRKRAATPPGVMSSAEVLDRLVAVAAALRVNEPGCGWVEVLERLVAEVRTRFFVTYAVACVERSVALGGQAPFASPTKKRFGQAQGKALLGLLERCCALQRTSGGGGVLSVMMIRTATAAISSCKEASRSRILPAALLGSGPMRLVVDMLRAAQGLVSAVEVLSGLVALPEERGTGQAADMFAAIASATANAMPRLMPSDAEEACTRELRRQAVTWLASTLSLASSKSVRVLVTSWRSDDVATALAVAGELTRRVPFVTKGVLRAVCEAAELASNTTRGGVLEHGGDYYPSSHEGGGTGGSERLYPARGEAALALLTRASRAALESPLLPLPAPSMPSPPAPAPPPFPPPTLPSPSASPEEDHFGRGFDIWTPRKDGHEPLSGDGSQLAETAGATAELLLDAFIQSPGTVMRALRKALESGNCSYELLVVQRALRTAICAPPHAANGGVVHGHAAITRTNPLQLGNRRAEACLLVGHLVESTAPGWLETKAIMNPPPPHLVEAAELTLGRQGDETSRRQQPLTALRLDLWLRSLLRDSDTDVPYASGDLAFVASFPDVFQTARTLARALTRRASSLTGVTDCVGRNGFRDAHGFPVSDFDPRPEVSDFRERAITGMQRKDIVGAVPEDSLPPARRALVGRLSAQAGLSNRGVLESWVTSVAKTVARYKRWLPWQVFAQELRETLLQQFQSSSSSACIKDAKGLPHGDAAAEAAAFAACELVAAWNGQEGITGAVFDPCLCLGALNSVAVPVKHEASPPLWLDVLRYLLDGDNNPMPTEQYAGVETTERFDRLAVAAAAALWIGGGASPGSRAGWMQWYQSKLVPHLGVKDSPGGGKWLVLSTISAAAGDDDDGDDEGDGDASGGGVQVRAGSGWPARVLAPSSWEDLGRSPVEAAWHIPAGGSWTSGCSDIGPAATPPPVLIPSFAAWLRVVLRGGECCGARILAGYIRRMSWEVYLPCEFGGASSEMARQWLGALIEAEVTVVTGIRGKGGGADNPTPPPGNVGSIEKARHAEQAPHDTMESRMDALASLFREELLRFGSGEHPGASVGGPLTWLWPLETVVSACGRAGPLGGRMSRTEIDHDQSERSQGCPKADWFSVDESSSALARALRAVPYDLLCGSRRFDPRRERLPPAMLRAFTTRAVDLAARALASPPCRHWSVAQRLLLGLGLLYHALSRPMGSRASRVPSSGHITSRETPLVSKGGTWTTGGGAGGGAGAKTDSEAAPAQVAALATIETLVRIALAASAEESEDLRRRATAAVGAGSSVGTATNSSIPTLPNSCRSLRPLDEGDCNGRWRAYIEALHGVGAWRAAATFLRQPGAPPARSISSDGIGQPVDK